MAALIDVYNPEFWAQETLIQLFPRLAMANLVHRDFESVIAEKGDTVNTRTPDPMVAGTVNPDAFASQVPTATNVQVVMDQWKHVTFDIGDKEDSLSMKRVYEDFLPNAAQALALDIEDALMGLYVDVYNFTGSQGTPMNDVAKISTNLQEKFNTLQIPRDGRYVGLPPGAENYFNQIFYRADVSGSAAQQTTGELRQKFGVNYFGADRLPDHANADPWAAATIDGEHLPGATSLVLASAGVSKTVAVGDLFTIDSGAAAGQYRAASATTTEADESVTVTIDPPLRGLCDGGEVVTPIAPHSNCLAFHKQAFALVSRPLAKPSFPGAAVSVANFNGVGLRASVWYEPKDKRSYVSLDVLYGVKTLDARKAFRAIY
jgi:hypothetical protein